MHLGSFESTQEAWPGVADMAISLSNFYAYLVFSKIPYVHRSFDPLDVC